MSEPSSSQTDVVCDICGHFQCEPRLAQKVIARATFPAFADRATRGCKICALIRNVVVSCSDSWSSVVQHKVLIDVGVIYARNKNSKELEVRGYELLGPWLPDQALWERAGNLRYLFSMSLYSPLGKMMRHRHNCRRD
jgi:hypothetical protein